MGRQALKRTVATTLAVAVAGLSAGCGGSDSDAPDDSASSGQGEAGQASDGVLALSAEPDGSLAYLESEASAPSGKLTVRFENPSNVVHDVVIEEEGGKSVLETDRVTKGTTKASAGLKPGTYTFYCSVTGHRGAGMEGTLTVN